MYQLLKNTANNNEWVFVYARQDYQNLYDEMTNNKIHLFVDPIVIDSSFTDSGTEKNTYSGKLMLLVSSDIDEDYIDRYVNNIKPLIDNAVSTLKSTLVCNEVNINKFTIVEVINLFDFNLDGVLVTYSITSNE